jgi:AcrR family transcriptional regulator
VVVRGRPGRQGAPRLSAAGEGELGASARPDRRRRPLRAARHRPGTAVRRKGLARREAILDAATAILIDEGYAELSTRKIAARAGIRPGNLQYYYPSKQDVVRAVLERYLERAMEAVEARVAQGAGDPAACLQAALTGLLAEQESADNCCFFWELWALAARDAAVAEAMSAFYERYWRGVVDVLMRTNSALGRARAERRAALLIAMLEGLTLFRARRDPRELPLPGLERELRALVHSLAMEAPGA